MWSVGCILAEMFGRKPIFPGEDYIAQVWLLFCLCPCDTALTALCFSDDAYIQPGTCHCHLHLFVPATFIYVHPSPSLMCTCHLHLFIRSFACSWERPNRTTCTSSPTVAKFYAFSGPFLIIILYLCWSNYLCFTENARHYIQKLKRQAKVNAVLCIHPKIRS